MITRGHYIGEIIDGLSEICSKVDFRCSVGLYDLNKYLEDFFKDFLNIMYSYNLVNANKVRSNEPGIDLIDEKNRVVFQITSVKTSAKVSRTLENIGEDLIGTYKVYILIIGQKQTSYTIKDDLMKKINFSEENIWDIYTLSKQLINISVENLKTLYTLINEESARIKIELEIPDANFKYPTSVLDYIEKIPKKKISDLLKFKEYLISIEPLEEDSFSSTYNDIKEYINILENLPRVTRELYCVIVERRDDIKGDIGGNLFFNYDRFDRICKYPDKDGDLRLLNQAGLISIDYPDEPNKSKMIKIWGQGDSDFLVNNIIEFIEENSIMYSKCLVHLDFSDF